jgi:hypothetical protein
MTACETTPRVEYIHEIPDVTFPVFPPPDSVTYDEEADTVTMPLWYWKEIAEYKLDVDAIRDYFTILRGYDDVKEMEKLKEQGIKKIDNTGGMGARAAETRKKVDKELEGK